MTATILLIAALLCVELPGKWAMKYETPGGTRDGYIDFTVEGEKVTAKIPEGTLKGTFKNGELDVSGETFSAEAGYKAVMKLKGKLEGDELKGNASWDTYQMTFTGKKAEN